MQIDDIAPSNGVIFDSQKIKYSTGDSKLQISKNVYLVRYVLGDFMKNEKTDELQQTINYNYPVEVLRVFSRQSVAYISVESDKVICKFKDEQTIQEDVLDEQTQIRIQVELAKKLENSSVFWHRLFHNY